MSASPDPKVTTSQPEQPTSALAYRLQRRLVESPGVIRLWPLPSHPIETAVNRIIQRYALSEQLEARYAQVRQTQPELLAQQVQRSRVEAFLGRDSLTLRRGRGAPEGFEPATTPAIPIVYATPVTSRETPEPPTRADLSSKTAHSLGQQVQLQAMENADRTIQPTPLLIGRKAKGDSPETPSVPVQLLTSASPSSTLASGLFRVSRRPPAIAPAPPPGLAQASVEPDFPLRSPAPADLSSQSLAGFSPGEANLSLEAPAPASLSSRSMASSRPDLATEPPSGDVPSPTISSASQPVQLQASDGTDNPIQRLPLPIGRGAEGDGFAGSTGPVQPLTPALPLPILASALFRVGRRPPAVTPITPPGLAQASVEPDSSLGSPAPADLSSQPLAGFSPGEADLSLESPAPASLSSRSMASSRPDLAMEPRAGDVPSTTISSASQPVQLQASDGTDNPIQPLPLPLGIGSKSEGSARQTTKDADAPLQRIALPREKVSADDSPQPLSTVSIQPLISALPPPISPANFPLQAKASSALTKISLSRVDAPSQMAGLANERVQLQDSKLNSSTIERLGNAQPNQSLTADSSTIWRKKVGAGNASGLSNSDQMPLPLPIRLSQGEIQRQMNSGVSPATSYPAPATALSPPSEQAIRGESPVVDIEHLAQQVSRILSRQLIVERERRGGGRW